MTTYDTRYTSEPRIETRASSADERLVERATSVRRPVPDRIRWGAVWAGLATAIAVFALLQLTFFATDAESLDVNPDGEAETTLPFWTGLAGAVGFLLGGLVTGASSRWRRVSDGILHGVIVWAVATLGLLLVAGLAAGSLTSSLGGTFGELADLRERVADGASLTDAELNDARDAAAAGVLLLGIMIVATIIGAVIGTKLWPRRGDTDAVVVMDRSDADWNDRGWDDRDWTDRDRSDRSFRDGRDGRDESSDRGTQQYVTERPAAQPYEATRTSVPPPPPTTAERTTAFPADDRTDLR
jgi:hypothetical protein